MSDDLILVVVGFLLTTVAGGLLGYYLQQRSWRASRRETERQDAAAVFKDISTFMDRRLYRMFIVSWRLTMGDQHEIRQAQDTYRAVLEEWNDNLNRNLALVDRYFGHAVNVYLDVILYEEFARLGRVLDEHLRAMTSPPNTLNETLKVLSDHVYNFDRVLIRLIQEGDIGLYRSPKGEGSVPLNLWIEIKRGAIGPQVVAWQRVLRASGFGSLQVDGRFGEATHRATIELQKDLSQDASGVVSPLTQWTLGQKHWRTRSREW